MKTAVFILFIALISLQKARGQAYTTNAKTLITSFLKEVYQTSDNSQKIAEDYIALSKENNEFSSAKRYEIVSQHIDMLRKGESISNDSKIIPDANSLNRFTIVSYASLSENTSPPFTLNDSQKKNVYVALFNNKAFRYFLIENNKILSFDYIKKGQNGPAYFFSY